MKRVLSWLNHNLEAVAGSICLVLMVVFTTLQVIGRHFFPKPFSWTEEMTRYLFVWMTYIALGYGVKEEKHIRILFVRNLFSKRIQVFFDLFSDFAFLVFTGICMVECLPVVNAIRAGGQTTVSIPSIHMWLVYAVLPVGFISLAFRLLQHMFKTIRFLKDGSYLKDPEERKENPDFGEGNV